MILDRRSLLLAAAGMLAGGTVRAQEHEHMMMAASDLAATPPVATNEVGIDNFSFNPPAVTVPVGSTVTWTNRDDIPHLVVADDHHFRSQALDTGDTFSFTFPAKGEFHYFCGLHPKMVGIVKVT